ncbi:MAG: OmpA family protein [Ignavibacteriaceae bacterium]|jgi:outer membrane protein OmpA-like peptidoglycan-associated protein|nr:OmpA family protein [Ignavibacteriaceae bacterium]
MKIIKGFLLSLVIVIPMLITGCNASNAVKGGAIGGAAGGVVGGVIGKQFGNTTIGAIAGAALGGTAGVLIGKHMDKQAEELKKEVENAKVERVGEGIKVTFDSGILFKTNEYELEPNAKKNVASLADILKKYPDSNIMVVGYTDSDGSEEYNKTLSEKRASSVADYAILNGISSSRINVVGLGETEFVASNETEAGKRQNRRVEIAIYANEKLKELAKDNELKVN